MNTQLNVVTITLEEYNELRDGMIESEERLEEIEIELDYIVEEKEKIESFLIQMWEDRIRDNVRYTETKVIKKDYDYIFRYDIDEIFEEMLKVMDYEKAKELSLEILETIRLELEEKGE